HRSVQYGVYRPDVKVVELDYYCVESRSAGLFRVTIIERNWNIAAKRHVAEVLDLECHLEVAVRTCRRAHRQGVVNIRDVGCRVGRTALRVQERRLVEEVVPRPVRSLWTVTHRPHEVVLLLFSGDGEVVVDVHVEIPVLVPQPPRGYPGFGGRLKDAYVRIP